MNDEQQKYIKSLTDRGCHVQLDKDDNVLFATYWHPELIISKIILTEEKPTIAIATK